MSLYNWAIFTLIFTFYIKNISLSMFSGAFLAFILTKLSKIHEFKEIKSNRIWVLYHFLLVILSIIFRGIF